ncbi:hypothetical protein CcI156_22740 [Frankia sp. CcI156]|uniref:Transcriptional regulator, XRE family n=1 Tax=Frankia casuarinae (strain DSM 45818 / CECT 9043 / HFP020203 / CcI3) TaxID=106370 RepID=Q2JEM5_FRACC|nr:MULTISPECIES: helix-turn-helix transcriptional regulator [Frankia]ABD10267.1 transcriptional regulator, XRE family [Frankia casuarinae]ONH21806.1 hypothetical protein CcI156_22740 [Frankia sp. CcI156]
MQDVELQRGLAQSVRKHRRQRGWSQAALAERLGLTRTTITNIEHGAQGITLLTFVRLAEQLNVGAPELLAEVIAGRPAPSAAPEAPGPYREWVASIASMPGDDNVSAHVADDGNTS